MKHYTHVGAEAVEDTAAPHLAGDNLVSAELKRAWLEDGFVKLPGAIAPDVIARYNRTVAAVRASVDDGKDAHGHGDRIGQLHQQETDLLQVAASEAILDFLRWAFSDEPIVMGSLNFERGTQQEAHIDAIFFWPEPSHTMAGVWVALEDINPDAGPLFYIPGSHRWRFNHSDDVAATRPDLAAERENARRGEGYAPDLIDRMGVAWTQDLVAAEQANEGRRTIVDLKAGDVVIWHSLLAHGGSPTVNPELSRRSVVFHYLGRKTQLYTFEQFMLLGRDELPQQPGQSLELKQYGDLAYMSAPGFVTYNNGAATTHEIGEPIGPRLSETAPAAAAPVEAAPAAAPSTGLLGRILRRLGL
ncbi:phytanoyl-CoA dioxygenase family protein [Caulobacter endophyticus]|uniref:phytanoyl-CoA dioxygenase family protein n=1 Tax=Caulobacter endophyticus TaxID=2172652 RepID=UPI00240EEA46|nr:phytanoyl-CoA dioxygenase family protein [Caulobacter endophyticus]MDG2528796.1 phytanoyl-CoA dioxygenase family protein [Caulobacter endophyticus]